MSSFLILAGEGKRCGLDLKAISCSSSWVFFFLVKIGAAGLGLCFSNFSYVCNVIYYLCFLFLLFIGLFSETCKCDILDGCLQPHGNCLSQFKAGPWGGSFAVPLLSTAAFAVF